MLSTFQKKNSFNCSGYKNITKMVISGPTGMRGLKENSRNDYNLLESHIDWQWLTCGVVHYRVVSQQIYYPGGKGLKSLKSVTQVSDETNQYLNAGNKQQRSNKDQETIFCPMSNQDTVSHWANLGIGGLLKPLTIGKLSIDLSTAEECMRSTRIKAGPLKGSFWNLVRMTCTWKYAPAIASK